jgi:hypothetical protein
LFSPEKIIARGVRAAMQWVGNHVFEQKIAS